MPRFRERPRVSCYGRRARATSGWARHGQIIRVALALLFYSRHFSLLDIEARSEQPRQRRSGSTQLDKYASSVRKMHWTVRPFLCRKPNTQLSDASQAPPDRARLRDRQRPTGLHHLLRRLGGRPHLPDPRRPRQSALVLVADRQRSDDRSDRVATLEEAKAQFQKSGEAWKAWAKLEEVP